jgi:hypothetical protein
VRARERAGAGPEALLDCLAGGLLALELELEPVSGGSSECLSLGDTLGAELTMRMDWTGRICSHADCDSMFSI